MNTVCFLCNVCNGIYINMSGSVEIGLLGSRLVREKVGHNPFWQAPPGGVWGCAGRHLSLMVIVVFWCDCTFWVVMLDISNLCKEGENRVVVVINCGGMR